MVSTLDAKASQQSIGTTKGSVVLSGWGDQEQPKPNSPSGPQGRSTLVAQTVQQDDRSGKRLPKTNDVISNEFSLLGLLLLLIVFLLTRLKKLTKGGEGA